MFEKLANIFRVPELRTRVLFTLGLLAVYRVGGHIPTPGINADLLQQFFEQQRGGFITMTVITRTAGTTFIMWLGEQITERGIGNGMSLLIFAGIVVGLPRAVVDLGEKASTRAWGAFTVPAMALLVGVMIAVVAFI